MLIYFQSRSSLGSLQEILLTTPSARRKDFYLLIQVLSVSCCFWILLYSIDLFHYIKHGESFLFDDLIIVLSYQLGIDARQRETKMCV